ncbi:hypothetical protein C8R46DRAFT_1293782 [Mycena filopes]|nr:hypothetical protein C8R46DRAFT_1293782 [Mycena filopes]
MVNAGVSTGALPSGPGLLREDLTPPGYMMFGKIQNLPVVKKIAVPLLTLISTWNFFRCHLLLIPPPHDAPPTPAFDNLSRCRRLVFLVYLCSRSVDSAAILRRIEPQRPHSTQSFDVRGSIERRGDGFGIAAATTGVAGGAVGGKHTSISATASPIHPPVPSSWFGVSKFPYDWPAFPTPARRDPDLERRDYIHDRRELNSTTGREASRSVTPSSAHNHSHQTIRIAVSLSVVGFILAIGLVLLGLWRRRRRTSERNSGVPPGAKPRSLTPFELIAADLDFGSRVNRVDRLKAPPASDPISTRQAYISNQVNRAREKVAELQVVTSTLLRQPSRSSDQETRSIPPETGDILQPDELNPPANDQRLERAVQQIEELNGRIRNLEHQRRSSWALGLSDAPPPDYIE